MDQNVFSWYRLWPDISLVLAGEINSPHGFSATIVVFLWFIAAIFLLFSVIKYIQARFQIRFYLKLLKESSKETLAKDQREISEKALSNKRYGWLWREFDETLVHSADGMHLYNTLDADHIFNTRTLARGLTENRLLAAVPGFLTAIGVIGTFAGLQMGLSSLELNRDVGVEALSSGIGNMISGASIAFLTSVWGVFISVVFNFIEKSFERHIRSKIYTLQNRIDFLYPRITAEQSLVDIADLAQGSNEVLHGLAEKIGDKMQEAVLQATVNMQTGIEDSLNKIMAPAIQALVDNAQNSSQQVLEDLTNKFMDGIGDAGKNQQQMMEDAAENVQTAITEMGSQMNTFVQDLDKQSKSNSLALKEQQLSMSQQMSSAIDKSNDVVQEMSSTFAEQIETQKLNDKIKEELFQSNISTINESQDKFSTRIESLMMRSVQNMNTAHKEQISAQKEYDELRSTEFQGSIESLNQVQKKINAQVQVMLHEQKNTNASMKEQFGHLLDSFNNVVNANKEAGDTLSKTATQMSTSVEQLNEFSDTIYKASEQMSEKISDASDAVKGLTEQNVSTAKQMQQTYSEFMQLRDDLSKVSNTLNNAAEHAESGFKAVDTHLDSFQKALLKNVTDLEDQISRLLTDYTEKVNGQTTERLNTWNEQTSTYIASMTDAVRTLQAVVDEIETKVGQ